MNLEFPFETQISVFCFFAVLPIKEICSRHCPSNQYRNGNCKLEEKQHQNQGWNFTVSCGCNENNSVSIANNGSLLLEDNNQTTSTTTTTTARPASSDDDDVFIANLCVGKLEGSRIFHLIFLSFPP